MKDMDSSEQEFNEHSSKRIQLIAPIDGVVTQISASVGQTVRPDLPIMTIVPEGSAAEVLLLIPSRSIGFIRMGQKVSVRYQAYPYEHYGRHYGVVKEIARAALPPQEVVQHIRVDEPVYTVRVALPSNYLEYQGRQLPLTPGMVVEADVELDRLKIYQWLLEPLYRLGGRV
jgi:membrane fusion protein